MLAKELRPTVAEVLPAVRAYMEKDGNAAGGSLHIVLCDANIEDGHIQFCRKWAMENGDDDGVVLCDLLLKLSRTQRRKIVRMY
jgi:hypothetical protein